MKPVIALLAAALAAVGCASTCHEIHSGVGGPDASFALGESLPAASLVFDLYVPRPNPWPRAMSAAGPNYLRAQASPLVDQFGMLAETNRAESGYGLGAIAGRRWVRSMSRTMGFEVLFEESSHHNPHSDVEGTAQRVTAGMTLGWRPSRTVQPQLSGGAGYYSLRFDELDPQFHLSGPGGYLAAGADVVATPWLVFNVEVRLHAWIAADASGNGGIAQTASVSAGTAIAF